MNRAFGVALSVSLVSLLGVLTGCAADAAPADSTDSNSGASTEESVIARRPIVGGSFSSVGDPHETSGDGATWDNQRYGAREGTFTAIKSLSAYTNGAQKAQFMLQKTQRNCANIPGLEMYAPNTVNVKVGVLLGQSKVVYDAITKLLVIDGKITTMAVNETRTLALGATVTRAPDANGMRILNMVSAFGDQVTIEASSYINIYGVLSANRKNDYVRGELGSFDADSHPGNDARSRDGLKLYNMNDATQASLFFDHWTTYVGESLYPL
jgi:hypothetical protein